MSSGAVSAGDPGLSLRERKRLRTAAAMYDAAAELLLEHSYDEITVDDICERAEVGRATFFRVFGTKHGLLEEFSRRLAEDADALFGPHRHTPVADQLRELAALVSATWLGHSPGVRRMAVEAIRAGSNDTGRAMSLGLITLVADLIRAGQASGELRSTSLAPESIAWMLVADLGVAVLEWDADSDHVDLPATTREVVDMVLGLLGVPSA